MSDTPKSALLYDLGALINENLGQATEAIAEALELSEENVGKAIDLNTPAYDEGEISQGTYWERVAASLDVEDSELIAAFALQTAVVNQSLLAHVRTQSKRMVLGLLSDATPDWVGHFRRQLRLDKLFHAHIIDSELEVASRSYDDLLRLSAERLQRQPTEVTFIDTKSKHLSAAEALGMDVINLADTADYTQAFRVIG